MPESSQMGQALGLIGPFAAQASQVGLLQGNHMKTPDACCNGHEIVFHLAVPKQMSDPSGHIVMVCLCRDPAIDVVAAKAYNAAECRSLL